MVTPTVSATQERMMPGTMPKRMTFGEEFGQKIRCNEVNDDEEQDDRESRADLEDAHTHLLLHVNAS